MLAAPRPPAAPLGLAAMLTLSRRARVCKRRASSFSPASFSTPRTPSTERELCLCLIRRKLPRFSAVFAGSALFDPHGGGRPLPPLRRSLCSSAKLPQSTPPDLAPPPPRPLLRLHFWRRTHRRRRAPRRYALTFLGWGDERRPAARQADGRGADSTATSCGRCSSRWQPSSVVAQASLISVVPGLGQRAEYAADRFRDRSAYAARVLRRTPVKPPPSLPIDDPPHDARDDPLRRAARTLLAGGARRRRAVPAPAAAGALRRRGADARAADRGSPRRPQRASSATT